MASRHRTQRRKNQRERVLGSAEGYCVLAGPNCEVFATTVDHWIPKCRGGGNASSNLEPSCYQCNQDKGDMMPEEWWAHVREVTGREWSHDDEGLRSRRVWSASEGAEDATLQRPLLPSSAEWASWAGGDLGEASEGLLGGGVPEDSEDLRDVRTSREKGAEGR